MTRQKIICGQENIPKEWKPGARQLDKFSEILRTAFDPPLVLVKYVADVRITGHLGNLSHSAASFLVHVGPE